MKNVNDYRIRHVEHNKNSVWSNEDMMAQSHPILGTGLPPYDVPNVRHIRQVQVESEALRLYVV